MAHSTFARHPAGYSNSHYAISSKFGNFLLFPNFARQVGLSNMAGYSTSRSESGIVSRPSAGASLRASSDLSDLRPIGTRHKETSRRVSRSSRRFTSPSTNPSTSSAGSPEAAETASIFASSVPGRSFAHWSRYSFPSSATVGSARSLSRSSCGNSSAEANSGVR